MDQKQHLPADVHRRVVELAESGAPFALAVILSAEGSVPQKAGVKAVIEATGQIWGTLGGGAVEAEAQRRAVEACRLGRAVVFDFSLLSSSPAECEPLCGGSMRVLLDPTIAEQQANRRAYGAAVEAVRDRRRGVLLTEVRRTDDPRVTLRWLPDSAAASYASFPGGAAIAGCLAREVSQRFVASAATAEAALEVLVEPIRPLPRLLIAGGGHVGQAVAWQADRLGFEITVIDDRPEFSDAARFPRGVATRCGPFAQQVAEFPLDNDTYVIIVTRGHQHDAEALAACVHAPLAYLGMIGSRRKVALMRAHFIDARLATAEQFDRLCAPVGLDIGAVTVPEIAVSIAAQLVAVRHSDR